jgi:tetratricopeptide (TPR) repeat protein
MLFDAPVGVPPLVHRAKMTRDYASYAFDLFRSAWWCARCSAHVASGPPAAVVAVVPYSSVEELVTTVERAARGTLEDGAGVLCDGCGGAAALDHLDYHAFCSARESDLVARFRPRGGVELLWWSGDGGYRAAVVDDDARRAFSRDALLRRAKAAREAGDQDTALRTLLAAAGAIPGDPELLRFMPWLCRIRNTSVAGPIAEAHTRARPEDPAGWYWAAQVHIELMACGVLGEEALAVAEQQLARALSLAPRYADGLVALANVSRLRGDEAAALATLERLLAVHPGHPEGSYTLGLMLLDRDPERALRCFEAGERAQPADADYPRGRARALLAMGRRAEALDAARRAQALAPADGRVAQILGQLGAG